MELVKTISLSSNVIAALTFGISLFAGMFQVHITKIIGGHTGLIHAFAAGTQLATILVDLLPHLTHSHSHDHGHDHVHHHDSNEFYPYMLIGFAFLSLLGLDYLYIKNKANPKQDQKSVETQVVNSNLNNTVNVKTGHSHDGVPCNGNHSTLKTAPKEVNNASQTEKPTHVHDKNGSCCAQSLGSSSSFFDAFCILSAISLPSFLEGLAFSSNVSSWPLIFGLILHKLLESFNVAFELSKLSLPSPKKVLLFLFYASLTPIAISLRSLSFLNSFQNIQSWCNALSLGAMLFVVFYEAIPHSFKNREHPYLNMISIVSGYALSSGSIIFAHSPHMPRNNVAKKVSTNCGGNCSHPHHHPRHN